MRKECGKTRREKISCKNNKSKYIRPEIEMEKEINVVIGGCGAEKEAKTVGSCSPITKSINS